MDGPALLHAGWFFSLVWVWIYRRYFEPVAPMSPEFEAFCEAEPRLAEFTVRPGSEAAVREAYLRILGKRREVVPTLAGYPWTLHVVKLSVTASPGKVSIAITSCRALRTSERATLALTDSLLALTECHADDIEDSWLLPEALVDVAGEMTAPHGWKLVPGANRRHPCEPRRTAAVSVALFGRAA